MSELKQVILINEDGTQEKPERAVVVPYDLEKKPDGSRDLVVRALGMDGAGVIEFFYDMLYAGMQLGAFEDIRERIKVESND